MGLKEFIRSQAYHLHPAYRVKRAIAAVAPSDVLNTAELLEHIIFQLPLVDVLRVQRVSKAWHATIAGSVKLQRALCFVPIHGKIRETDKDRRRATIFKDMMSPVIAYGPEPTLEAYSSFNPVWTASAQNFYDHATSTNLALLNPFLISAVRLTTADTADYSAYMFSSARDATESSWRRMYATQPPTDCIYINLYSARDVNGRLSSVPFDLSAIHNKNGVTNWDVMKSLSAIDIPVSFTYAIATAYFTLWI